MLQIELLNYHSASSNDSNSLQSDIQSFYKNRSFSDVKIKVGEEILEAHKFMLSGKINFYVFFKTQGKFFFFSTLSNFEIPARSSVFASMFTADMSESNKNIVIINDFEFDVMQELIRFIYTDQVENMKELATSLLLAADKVSFRWNPNNFINLVNFFSTIWNLWFSNARIT